MRYKIVSLYSAGDEHGSLEKRNICLGILALVILIALHIANFVICFIDKNIMIAILCLLITGWFPLLILNDVKLSYWHLKNNKLINLYFYELEEFTKECVSNDKFIIVIDKHGVILGEKNFKKESKHVCCGTYLSSEVKCLKHAVDVTIINNN